MERFAHGLSECAYVALEMISARRSPVPALVFSKWVVHELVNEGFCQYVDVDHIECMPDRMARVARR